MRFALRRLHALDVAVGKPTLGNGCNLQFLARKLPSKRILNSLSGAAALSPKPRPNPNEKFNPKSIEQGWYKYWDSRGLFEPHSHAKPETDEPKETIRMLLPPPNVTGQLHIGHALMLAIQDSLARFYRMDAHPVHWAPGTDHAGIATQSVVERMLEKQQGTTRKELGREGLVAEIKKWREQYGGRILEQISRMGTSTTNSAEYFTLDPGLSEAVTNAFVRLHKEGLVYRDTRMVNWSVTLQTAISDIEVAGQEIVGPTKIGGAEFGVLHKFAFPLADGSGEVVVSTTRPETIPGDRAVAVHIDDERYKHLHYKLLRHPLFPSITLPIIPCTNFVDPEFGTGAVKITPAHDEDDYAFWKKYSTSSPSHSTEAKLDIPIIPVFDTNGKILASSGLPEKFVGIDRLFARKKVVDMLVDACAYRGKESHKMRLGTCDRSGSIIEPMLQPQWYLRTKPLAEEVLAQSEGLTIKPEEPYAGLWKRWLEEIQDWCLSRQIWWGHRIPAFQVVYNGQTSGEGAELKTGRWIVAKDMEEARKMMTAEERAGGADLRQDEDVLDTWFSSALLPMSTVGWRGNEEEPQRWKEGYPLSFIESGGDILFFWLARMAMLCTWFSGSLPFKEIILHPLVCDGQGRKMSKSVGNVLDPMAVVEGRSAEEMMKEFEKEFDLQMKVLEERKHEAGERGVTEFEKKAKELKKWKNERIKGVRTGFPAGIKESGADALRIALVDYTKQSRQINMELRHVDTFRRFEIKLDNAFKFYLAARANISTPHAFVPTDARILFSPEESKNLKLHDIHMLHHLRQLITTCRKAFQERKLYPATEEIRHFFIEIFCSVYLEFIKKEVSADAEPVRRQAALSIFHHSLDTILRLSHPFIPYFTESLWQELSPSTRAEIDSPEASIMVSPYPKETDFPRMDEARVGDMETVMQLVEELRSFAARNAKEKRPVAVCVGDGALKGVVDGYRDTLNRIAKVTVEEVVEAVEGKKVCEGEGWTEVTGLEKSWFVLRDGGGDRI
ncbi:hypothetical protein RUND412_007955 [Rhizina undulata]